MLKKKRLILVIIDKNNTEQLEKLIAAGRVVPESQTVAEIKEIPRKQRLSPLEFQDEINNELWLHGNN